MNSADCYPSYASFCATYSFSIALYSCSIDRKEQEFHWVTLVDFTRNRIIWYCKTFIQLVYLFLL